MTSRRGTRASRPGSSGAGRSSAELRDHRRAPVRHALAAHEPHRASRRVHAAVRRVVLRQRPACSARAARPSTATSSRPGRTSRASASRRRATCCRPTNRGTWPSRVLDLIPDVRLIALVRQPVDRMYSAMFHEIRRGRLRADTDLFAMVDRGSSRRRRARPGQRPGCTPQNLYPYWNRFGEQLLVVFQDDVRTQPEKVYETVLRHIGAVAGLRARRIWTACCSATARPCGSPVRGPPTSSAASSTTCYRDDVEELEAMIGARPVPVGPRTTAAAMTDATERAPAAARRSSSSVRRRAPRGGCARTSASIRRSGRSRTSCRTSTATDATRSAPTSTARSSRAGRASRSSGRARRAT